MTPQVKTILTHLQKHGSLSQAEAGLIYKIRALPRRIADLKAEGFTIKSELKQDATGQRYARYTLVTEVKTTEPRTDAPVVALNVKPKVGDKVVVVKPWVALGDYKLGDIGVVTSFYEDNPEQLMVDFQHKPEDCVWVKPSEVEVIANA